jgi:hypothetical protein
VPGTRVTTGVGRRPAQASLATLDAMADLARRSGSVVHVIVKREPNVVEHARELARRMGIDVQVDLMPYSVRVRFGSG